MTIVSVIRPERDVALRWDEIISKVMTDTVQGIRLVLKSDFDCDALHNNEVVGYDNNTL